MGPVRQNPIQTTVSLFIYVCIALCTIVAHNIAQNRPDSFPPYPPDNHHCSDDVYDRNRFIGRPSVKRLDLLCYQTVVCLSVTLVYCGQTVGWINMKLGMQVGLRPCHTVLDGDRPSPPQSGTVPQFSAHIWCGQMAGWIKMPLHMEVVLSPGDFLLDGDAALSLKRGAAPNFRPMFIVAKQLDGSRWHFAWTWALVKVTMC